MVDPRCISQSNFKKIKIADSGKHIIIRNDKQEEFTIYQIDGCVIVDGKRADKLVRNPRDVDVILEFKGGDIAGAAKQIEATAAFWLQKQLGVRPIHGCIISTHTPAFNPTIQRVKLEHKRKFGGTFSLRKPFREYAFRTLIKASV